MELPAFFIYVFTNYCRAVTWWLSISKHCGSLYKVDAVI